MEKSSENKMELALIANKETIVGKQWFKFGFKYFLIVAIVVLISDIVSKNVVFLARVSGDSMNPTYNSGDLLLVNKLINSYNSGDIVIISNEIVSKDPIVKRVVGVPGDRIKITLGTVYVNDIPLEERYIKSDDEDSLFYDAGILSNEIELGENEYIVLGDNRYNSVDSRVFGIVQGKDILGKVL